VLGAAARVRTRVEPSLCCAPCAGLGMSKADKVRDYMGAVLVKFALKIQQILAGGKVEPDVILQVQKAGAEERYARCSSRRLPVVHTMHTPARPRRLPAVKLMRTYALLCRLPVMKTIRAHLDRRNLTWAVVYTRSRALHNNRQR